MDPETNSIARSHATVNRDENDLIEDLKQHQCELQQQNEELRRTHVELNRLSQRYHDLWNNAPVGYVGMLRTGTITSANRRARALLGKVRVVRDDALFQSFLNAPSQRIFRQHLSSTRLGKTSVAELRLDTESTSDTQWLRIESSIADGEFRSVITDISSQKQSELERLQSQKMEALHSLSGGIAHDFNNILQVISAYGQLLKMKLGEPGNENLLDALLSGIKRGADLTERLTVFGRRATLQTEATDLNDIIRTSAEIFSRTTSVDIQVSLNVSDNPVTADLDANQIHQAMLNLYLNARDAMPDGGKLHISLDRRRLDDPIEIGGTEMQTGDVGVITIADTGIGMDQETQARMYEPFFTTKGSGSGTGLGLAIVHGIITQHGGAITVSSTANKGTCFEIYIPCCTQEVNHSEATFEAHLPLPSSGSILLAEDEPAIREALFHLLESAGFQVTLAADGLEAFDYFESGQKFDLILTDIMMPHCSGRRLCEQIHLSDPTIPFIFLTGYGEQIVDTSFLKSHCVTLLKKPVDYDELVDTINEKLLESHDHA